MTNCAIALTADGSPGLSFFAMRELMGWVNDAPEVSDQDVSRHTPISIIGQRTQATNDIPARLLLT
ncbi:MAG: hypothetical protein JXB07_15815 [Anaerolineae bacterium]|nr:hypothetical protein [Anaerolineae bacterium]